MSTPAESLVEMTHAGQPRAGGVLRRCPVCGSERRRAIHTQRYALFDDSRLPRETQICTCDECGMAFAVSCATAQDYRGHYARHSKYDTAVSASGSGESAHDAKRLTELVEWLAPHVAAESAILDVGAGRGGLAHAFRQHGYPHVSGLDPAEGCVAAMRTAGLCAHVGELEADHWPTDPDRFELIVLSHVIEHVFDATAALSRAAQRISPRGLVYVEVPDASRYTLEGFPPFYFFDPEHINHFDANSLEVLAMRCGMRVRSRWNRTLAVGPGQSYPAVGVLLEARGIADADASAAAPRADTETPLVRYLAACRASMAKSVDPAALAGVGTARRPVIVWGAGSHAQRLLAQTLLGTCAIDCIIDADVGKQGRRLAGHTVVSPEDGLARAQTIRADVAVAIAIGAESAIERVRRALPAARVFQL